MAGSPKKRARRLGIESLDQPTRSVSIARERPALEIEPHNKVRLSEANRQKVIQALLDGYPQAAIAKALSMSAPTLRRLLADDRDLMEAVEAQRSFEETELRDILMELARRGDTVAAIFLAKARHGWRDREDPKLKVEPGRGGVLLVPGTMNFEEWSAAAAAQQAKFRERNLATDPTAPGAERL